MPPLTFVKRSLAESSRKGGTYLVRLLILAAAALTLLGVQASAGLMGAPGLTLFRTLAYLNLVLVALGGPAYFASVITEEKEAGTLGLLKMTGLPSASILLGKWTSEALSGVVLLLTQIPLVMLAITLGGVAPNQIAAGVLAILAFLVLVANVGLLVSVICNRSSAASVLTVILLASYFGGPHLLRAVLDGAVRAGALGKNGLVAGTVGPACDFLIASSPFYRMREVLGTGFSGSIFGFQFWTNLAGGGAFFALAWAAFGRFTRQEARAAAAGRPRFGRGSRLRFLRAGRPWRWALAWKDYHFLAGGHAMLLAKLVLVGLAAAGITAAARWSGARFGPKQIAYTIAGVATALMVIELVLQSSRIFGKEHKEQTLSALLLLPKSTRRVAYEKALGHAVALLPYAFWYAVAGALWVRHGRPMELGWQTAGGLFRSVMSFLLLLHIIAFLSLLFSRGAVVLGLVAYYFGLTLLNVAVFALFFGLGSGALMRGVEFTMYGVVPTIYLAIAAVLHVWILKRIRAKAAQE